MGNHCIDCEFCGQDRRLIGGDCCDEAKAAREKKEADAKAKYEAEEKYLATFGLDVNDSHGLWVGKVYAEDVVKVLKKFEGKVLKPGRPKRKPKVVDYEY
jgi:hypothetical protein